YRRKLIDSRELDASADELSEANVFRLAGLGYLDGPWRLHRRASLASLPFRPERIVMPLLRFVQGAVGPSTFYASRPCGGHSSGPGREALRCCEPFIGACRHARWRSRTA